MKVPRLDLDDINIEVTVPGFRILKFRIWLAIQFLRIAIFLLDTEIDVKCNVTSKISGDHATR